MNIFVILTLILLYAILGAVFFMCIKSNNPFYKFKLSKPDWYGDTEVIHDGNPDSIFWATTLIIFWVGFLTLYYIPKGLFKLLKFFTNYIGWIIAKIFKL